MQNNSETKEDTKIVPSTKIRQAHAAQSTFVDDFDTRRCSPNMLVRKMMEECPVPLYMLTRAGFSHEDILQVAQLTGMAYKDYVQLCTRFEKAPYVQGEFRTCKSLCEQFRLVFCSYNVEGRTDDSGEQIHVPIIVACPLDYDWEGDDKHLQLVRKYFVQEIDDEGNNDSLDEACDDGDTIHKLDYTHAAILQLPTETANEG